MSVVFLEKTENITTSGTSLAIDYPDNLTPIQAGDDLIIAVAMDRRDASGTTVPGFTIRGETFLNKGSQGHTTAHFHRVADGTETGSVTISMGTGTADGISATMLRYSGSDGSATPPFSISTSTVSTTTPAAPGSVLSDGDEFTVVALCGSDSNAAQFSAVPTGYEDPPRVQTGGDATGVSIMASDIVVTGDGSTTYGDESWTLNTSRGAVAGHIALKAAATAPAEEAEGAHQGAGNASLETEKGATAQAAGQGAGSYSAQALTIKNAVVNAAHQGAGNASLETEKGATAQAAGQDAGNASLETAKGATTQAVVLGGESGIAIVARHATTRLAYSLGGISAAQNLKGAVSISNGQGAYISDTRNNGAHNTQSLYNGAISHTAGHTTAKSTQAAYEEGGTANSTHSAGFITAVNAVHQGGGTASVSHAKGAAAMAAFNSDPYAETSTVKGAIAVLRFHAGATSSLQDSPGFVATVNGNHQGAGFGTIQHTTNRNARGQYNVGAGFAITDLKAAVAIVAHNGDFISTSLHIKAVDAIAHYQIGALYQALTQPIILPTKITLGIDHVNKIGLSIEGLHKIGLSLGHEKKITLTIDRE